MKEKTKKRKIKPVGHRLLVRCEAIEKEKEKKTEGGVIFEFKTDDQLAREALSVMEARVMDVGEGAFKGLGSGTPWCKVGDLVLINRYSGINRDDIEEDVVYRIINDEDVIALFEGE